MFVYNAWIIAFPATTIQHAMSAILNFSGMQLHKVANLKLQVALLDTITIQSMHLV